MFRSQINPPRSFQRFSASDLATSHSSLAAAPLTPFPATLGGKSQLIENPAALSPAFAALTSRVRHKSSVCHSYKKHPGWVSVIVNFFVAQTFVAQTSVCAPLGQFTLATSESKQPQDFKNLAVLPAPNHRSPVTALVLVLPSATIHPPSITKSFTTLRLRAVLARRIRTYEKPANNSFGIRTSKTEDLKPFRMNTYEKTGGRGRNFRSATRLENSMVNVHHGRPPYLTGGENLTLLSSKFLRATGVFFLSVFRPLQLSRHLLTRPQRFGAISCIDKRLCPDDSVSPSRSAVRVVAFELAGKLAVNFRRKNYVHFAA